MPDFALPGRLRRALRDALPASLGLCLTLRANPLLGLAFRFFRREFRVEGMRFEVPLDGQPQHSLATYWFDDYEKPERQFCKQLIRPDDRVCELGGCLGVVSMVINRRLTAPACHIVVEANPRLKPFIERNRARNQGQFKLIHAAVGDGNPSTLALDGGPLTSTSALPGSCTEVVPGVTLDELWHLHGPFNTLVMDIEGSEQDVLCDSVEAWKTCRLIIAEWHPALIGTAAVDAIRSRLKACGFECVGSQAGELHVVEAWQCPDPS